MLKLENALSSCMLASDRLQLIALPSSGICWLPSAPNETELGLLNLIAA